MSRPNYSAVILNRELAKARTAWLAAVAREDREAEAFAMQRLNHLLGELGRARSEPSKL